MKRAQLYYTDQVFPVSCLFGPLPTLGCQTIRLGRFVHVLQLPCRPSNSNENLSATCICQPLLKQLNVSYHGFKTSSSLQPQQPRHQNAIRKGVHEPRPDPALDQLHADPEPSAGRHSQQGRGGHEVVARNRQVHGAGKIEGVWLPLLIITSHYMYTF
jgi:hypothetical protein